MGEFSKKLYGVREGRIIKKSAHSVMPKNRKIKLTATETPNIFYHYFSKITNIFKYNYFSYFLLPLYQYENLKKNAFNLKTWFKS